MVKVKIENGLYLFKLEENVVGKSAKCVVVM